MSHVCPPRAAPRLCHQAAGQGGKWDLGASQRPCRARRAAPRESAARSRLSQPSAFSSKTRARRPATRTPVVTANETTLLGRHAEHVPRAHSVALNSAEGDGERARGRRPRRSERRCLSLPLEMTSFLMGHLGAPGTPHKARGEGRGRRRDWPGAAPPGPPNQLASARRSAFRPQSTRTAAQGTAPARVPASARSAVYLPRRPRARESSLLCEFPQFTAVTLVI